MRICLVSMCLVNICLGIICIVSICLVSICLVSICVACVWSPGGAYSVHLQVAALTTTVDFTVRPICLRR